MKQEINHTRITKQNAFPATVDVSYVLIEMKTAQGVLGTIMILPTVLLDIFMPMMMITPLAFKIAQLHQAL